MRFRLFRTRPPWVAISATNFRVFEPSGRLVLQIDGTNNVLSGTFRTHRGEPRG